MTKPGQLATTFGPPARQREPKPLKGPAVIPTGNFDLDYRILTVGGICRGRITEIFGRESSGKSAVVLHTVANAQHAGLRCAYIDTEYTLMDQFGNAWMDRIGVDRAALDLWPTNGPAEDVLWAITKDLNADKYDVVAIDSLAFLQPRHQFEDATADKLPSHVGIVAGLAGVLTRQIPALQEAAYYSNAAVIVTNQVRELIDTNPLIARTGKLKRAAQGLERTPGGRAWRHAVSVRLMFQRVDAIQENDILVGTVAEALLVKSKVSPPLRRTGEDAPEIRFYFDGRIQDESSSLFDWALSHHFVEMKPGGRYYCGDQLLAVGKQALHDRCDAEPAFLDWIRNEVMGRVKSDPSTAMYAAAAEEGVKL